MKSWESWPDTHVPHSSLDSQSKYFTPKDFKKVNHDKDTVHKKKKKKEAHS